MKQRLKSRQWKRKHRKKKTKRKNRMPKVSALEKAEALAFIFVLFAVAFKDAMSGG